MNDSEINDTRLVKEFKGITFSKFKKSEVQKALLKSLNDSEIESSLNWSIELICSGHFMDLWEIILLFMSKYIHSGNPKLSIYIDLRFQNFKDIVVNGYNDNEIAMRNNEKIRKLFCEIISVLCYSRKKHPFQTIKVRQNEFDMTVVTSKLSAKHIGYIKDVFLDDDPKELFIALNELAYHISKDSKNMIQACYWVEWIIEYDAICKKKKTPLFCERRNYNSVNTNYQKDIIWMVWNLLIFESEKKDSIIQKIVKSCFNIFTLRYLPGMKKKRRFIIYFVVELLTEKLNMEIPIIQEKDKKHITMIVEKNNILYKHVKKNEVKPKTDYLFNNKIVKSNAEKTIDKIDKMNNIITFIPRNN